jgi:ribose-phosphate pyrophosphokinase
MSSNGTNGLSIFSGRNTQVLTRRICDSIDHPLANSETEVFPDGEILVKVKEDVRGKDCFVVISTCQPVNDNLAELLIFVDCLKRASARQVTCVVPYYGYARQDRKDKGRVPITAKLVANLVAASNADRVVTCDLHAAQIQGFFDIPVDHLHATPVFHRYFQSIREELGDLCMVSPDVGNMKVAEGFANLLDGSLAIINKKRKNGRQIEADQIIGSVKDKSVLMFDDMISTAGTVCRAAEMVLEAGAKQVVVAATHPLFADPAVERLSSDMIHRVVCTDTIPAGNRPDVVEHLGAKYVELSVANLLGEAIVRIHEDRSISELFDGTAGVKR